MSRGYLLNFLILVASFTMAGLALGQTCADVHGTTTGCAPSPLAGQTVELTGIVYVVPGTYNSGSVYFNCGAGGMGGMTLYDPLAVVADGDEITVTGTIGAFNEEIQFDGGASIVVNSSGNVYTPEIISTGALAAGTPHLGGFMQVTGILAVVTPGVVYTVDDGTGPVVVYIDSTTDIDTNVLDQWLGDLLMVNGSTKCYNGQGEILHRSRNDLTMEAVAEGETSSGSLKRIYR